MSPTLADFHLKCRRELNALLKSFNILFYGYGSKRMLLLRMFPGAFYFNCRLARPRDILGELASRLRMPQVASMHELDVLVRRREKHKLILANFDFEAMEEFAGLRSFAVLATMESVNVRFSEDDVRRLNFIFRDLTTFEPYEEETVDIQLRAGKTEMSLNVVRNIPRSARLALKEILLLSADTVGLDELFERTKRKLFLTSKTALLSILGELIDHRILRMRDSTTIAVGLSAAERKRLLDSWAQFETQS